MIYTPIEAVHQDGPGSVEALQRELTDTAAAVGVTIPPACSAALRRWAADHAAILGRAHAILTAADPPGSASALALADLAAVIVALDAPRDGEGRPC
jgi:hypothetical protein